MRCSIIAIDDTSAIEVVARVGIAGCGVDGGRRCDGDGLGALSVRERTRKDYKKRVEVMQEGHFVVDTFSALKVAR